MSISQELVKLWDEEQGQDKVRASLFTLVLYVEKSERAEFFDTLTKKVVSKFPCRMIMIVEERDAKEPYLRTSVDSQTVGEGDLQIFCEFIQIEVAGNLKERVPFLVLPHLLPDLPIYLLWTQDPTSENAVLPTLEPHATRIIFDSESSQNLQQFAQSVLSLIGRFHCEIGDLNWSALSGWRNIFNQLFSTPSAFEELSHAKSIKITYNKNPQACAQHCEIEAAYFQGWIASRLGWVVDTFENKEGIVNVTYKRGKDKVCITLSPKEHTELASGSLLSLEIESTQNKAHYQLVRQLKTRQIFIQYSNKSHCDLPYHATLSNLEEGQEIIEEIFYPNTGTHYASTLQTLATLPWRS